MDRVVSRAVMIYGKQGTRTLEEGKGKGTRTVDGCSVQLGGESFPATTSSSCPWLDAPVSGYREAGPGGEGRQVPLQA